MRPYRWQGSDAAGTFFSVYANQLLPGNLGCFLIAAVEK
jgi:hypothetical protein